MMRSSGSLLSSFILFVFSFSPFVKVLSQIVATFLGLWKCGVTIAECAHVHSSAQSAWNVYNLPRTATAEISTELDESWMCVCLRTILLQSLVSPGAPEISFPSGLVVFSLCVSSESYLLSQGGKFSIGVFFEQDPLLSLSAKITLISFPSALVVFSLSVSSELNLLSQGGKSSIGVFFEQDPVLSLSAKITFVTISFPSVLVVFSLSVSSESYLLSQGGKSSLGTCVHVQSCVLSEVIGIAWAVHHVGACVAHTEQVWSTGFHSGSNAYYITPHSQT